LDASLAKFLKKYTESIEPIIPPKTPIEISSIVSKVYRDERNVIPEENSKISHPIEMRSGTNMPYKRIISIFEILYFSKRTIAIHEIKIPPSV
jgi:hypothetical protein